MRKAGVFSRSLLLLCCCAVLAQAQPDLRQTGTGALDEVSASGVESFHLRWEVENQGAEPIAVEQTRLYFAHCGGWLHFVGPLLQHLPVQVEVGKKLNFDFNYRWSTPVSHAVIATPWQARGASGGEALAIPLPRQGFAPVPEVRFALPVDVGVVGPLEAFRFGDGKLALWVIGQVQALGDPVDVQRVVLRVQGSRGEQLSSQTVANELQGKADDALRPFSTLHPLPEDFRRGVLRVEVEFTSAGGTRTTYRRSFPVERIRPLAVTAPVRGAWHFGNGPGQTNLHVHTGYPEQRYAYDLTVRRNGRTYDGDPSHNASFYAWDQPIFAALPGEVMEVIDDVPDDPGFGDNPANNPRRNSYVILAHAGGVFTLYSHPRQGSALVKVGDRVEAGQMLARVGNAGFSSEPHLHFAAFRLDQTGRLRALPVRFADLRASAEATAPLPGVPLGGFDYLAGK